MLFNYPGVTYVITIKVEKQRPNWILEDNMMQYTIYFVISFKLSNVFTSIDMFRYRVS